MGKFENTLYFLGYDINKAFSHLEVFHNLSLEKKNNWIEEQKWIIARYHYLNNPCYKKKVKRTFPKLWEDLPIMEKSDYQNSIDEMLSKGYSRKNTYIANTSGSSGHPFFYAKNKFAHAMSWALIKKRYSWHDIGLNSKQARFFGLPLETTSKFQEKLKDYISNRVRFNVFDMSQEILNKFVDIFYRNKFEFVYGYVNSLVLFGRYLLEKKMILNQICPSIKCCITTAEVLTKEDRKILFESFGVPIINEYGISEAGAIAAFENKNGDWILNNETHFIEVVDKEGNAVDDGKIGEIVITDLNNKAMPFIRYKVGDIGIIKKGTSLNGYKVLQKLLGRTNDNIRLPSGRVSPGLTFYYISRSILESSGVLKEFIIRQTAIDMFVFDIVSDRDISDNEINDIKYKMDMYLEPGLELKLNRVKKIIRPTSGKLKHFYSELS